MKQIVIAVFVFSIGISSCTDWLGWFGLEEKDEIVLATYLRGSSGPYRGRVIDAKTKKPIGDAVVVAVWYHDVYAFVQTNSRFYDAIEVTSENDGYFVIDAPNIERKAPRRTKWPVVTIFKTGYGYFEGWLATEAEMFDRKNRPLLRVVGLESISSLSKSEQSRRRPNDPRVLGVPDEKVPIFLKAIEEQRAKFSK